MNKEEKFHQLWEQYSPEVFRFCMFRLGNKENAEDITAEVFLKLYQQDMDSIKNMRAWLFTVARNVIYDLYVKKKHITMSSAHLQENVELTESQIKDVTQNAEKIALDKRMLELIEKELKKLNPKDSEIIILKIWHDLSFREISDIVNLKESAVKQKFYRNLQKIIYNINTPRKRRFPFGFKIRNIAIGSLIAGIFKISFASQYVVHAESLNQSLNIKLGALGLGTFVSSSGILGTIGVGGTAAAINTTATAAVGAGATASAGGLFTGVGSFTGGAAALSSGAQIAVAAITTAALATGGIVGINTINDAQPSVAQNQQHMTPNTPTVNPQSPTDQANSDAVNDQTQVDNVQQSNPTTSCDGQYFGSAHLPIAFNYDSCAWSIDTSQTNQVSISKEDNTFTIAKASNLYTRKSDQVLCNTIDATYISDKTYRASRGENQYFYEPASTIETKQSLFTNTSKDYCSIAPLAFTLQDTNILISYEGTQDFLPEIDAIVNSAVLLNRVVDEGDVGTKLYTSQFISFSYPGDVTLQQLEDRVILLQAVEFEHTDFCTNETASNLEYLHISISHLPQTTEEYINSFVTTTEEGEVISTATFTESDLFGKPAFIKSGVENSCNVVKYIIPSGNNTLIIERQILPNEEQYTDYIAKEEKTLKQVLQTLVDLAPRTIDTSASSYNIDLYFIKAETNELVKTWRTVNEGSLTRTAIDLLITGPNSNELQRGLTSPLTFSSDSTCNGQDYALLIQSEKMYVQFCRDIVSNSPEHQKIIVSSIYQTIHEVAHIDYINIKDASGECLFGISQPGLNSCQLQSTPLQ